MDYRQAVAYIHSLLRFGIRPGLERMADMMGALGNPQENLPVVHVAGTNGKGSTSTMISNILIASGIRTGLFTSPFVCDFMERIQLDGEPADREAFAQVVTHLRDIAGQMGDSPTEFELITAAAYELFRQLGCGAAVMETGLGGRLDSTNIVRKPCVCVITSISMDHMNVLGDTIEQIAAEKCGIFKPGVPVVVSGDQNPQAMAVIERIAREMDCELLLPQEEPELLESGLFGITFLFEGETYRISMPGAHQVRNAVNAILAARELQRQGFPIRSEHIVYGIGQTVLPARIQVMQKEPLVVLDGAHNEDGVQRLADTLRTALPGQKFVFVSGMMADKEYEKALSILADLVDTMVTTTPGNPRALSAEVLAECAQRHGIRAVSEAEPVSACRKGEQLAREKQLPLIVNGSLYLAGDVYPYLKNGN